jgi:hypothetical protein
VGYWGRGQAYDAARQVEHGARAGDLEPAASTEARLGEEIERLVHALEDFARGV